MSEFISHQKTLRDQLWASIRSLESHLEGSNCGHDELDFVISHCEVNFQQGVGILLNRIFSNHQQIFSIRSRNFYAGHQCFGARNSCISLEKLSARQATLELVKAIGNVRPRRILSVPYFTDDILSALAIKDMYDDVDLCTYIMDDQNIYVNNIPDELMFDLLQKSKLRLGISKDICEAYGQKFNLKFWFLPPLVQNEIIQTNSFIPSLNPEKHYCGVLIGNIWCQRWLDQLRLLTRKTGIHIDWYGNPNREWLDFSEEELIADGIHFKGFKQESELIEILRGAYFAVILTGDSNEIDDRPELAKLSLPSRLTYIISVANTPIIVIGSSHSSAAKFVQEYQLGLVCDYLADSFAKAVSSICTHFSQQQIRQQAARLAQTLSTQDIQDWIWRSLKLGKPINLKFEQLSTTLTNATAVITACEINDLHGTGVLVKRIVANTPHLLSIRSMDLYNGQHNFSDLSFLISHVGLTRKESTQKILRFLGENTIKQVLCVPYRSDDLITSIILNDLFNAPIGVYIMDDQNICDEAIPDDLMREFLHRCSFRLATHPELRDAYEAKYGLKFWVLPAVAPHHLITDQINLFSKSDSKSSKGILIGSLWSPKWFELLCKTVFGAGAQLDWYGNFQYDWIQERLPEMQNNGISPFGVLPEAELAEQLKRYAYVIVPTGTLDERDDRHELSRLSLPGRIIFALATSNTPVIILGSEKTSAARFVKRFNIGLTCDYEPESLKNAIARISQFETQQEMRANAANLAHKFSSLDVNHWLWKSIQLGEPADLRFECLFNLDPEDETQGIVSNKVQSLLDLYGLYLPIYSPTRLLSQNGLTPEFIVDIGSSHGFWSYTASQCFSPKQFILIDPLMAEYQNHGFDYYLRKIPNALMQDYAICNSINLTDLQYVSSMHQGSLESVYAQKGLAFVHHQKIQVKSITLDQFFQDHKILGKGMIRMDVQGAEDLVLAGATHILHQINAIVIELSLLKYDAMTTTYTALLELITGYGFKYFAETREWSSPVNASLLQKEIAFVRK